MLSGKKYILVAGGAGFIGSHLVDRLLRDEACFIDVLDDFSTGHVRNLDDAHRMVKDVYGEDSNRLRVVYQDISRLVRDPSLDRHDGSSRRSNITYDVIFNLASPASPKAYQADELNTVVTNVVGTANLLALAEQHHAIFVQASTSEVYGDPLEHPQRESYNGNVNMLGIRACYDESKRCAETLCSVYCRRGVDTRVARIFNTYGPRLDPDDGRVINTFVRQAIVGDPITVFGDGSQTRSFAYVSDTIGALISLSRQITWDHGPVNVGNDSEFKISELPELLCEWFPRLLVINEPLPADDPKVRRPDLSLARRELDYEPRICLRDGLKATIEWMRTRMTCRDA